MNRETDNKDQHLLRTSPVGIVTLSAKGKLLSINLDGLNIMGYQESDLLGTRLTGHVHQSEHERLRTVYKELRRGVSGWLQSEHRIRHANGHYVIVHSHNAVATSKKKKRRWIISVFIQSDDREVMTNSEQGQNNLLQAMPINLTQEMTENLAHEINQPLAAIAMYARVTQRLLHNSDLKNVDVNHALAQLSEQVYRASDVVSRLRSWSKVSSAQRDHVDFAALVNSLYPLLLFESQQADLRLELESEADLPNVDVDPGQIQHVILVLVRSSIEEFQTLDTACKTLRVNVRNVNSGEIEFSVHNSAEAHFDTSIDHPGEKDLASSIIAQNTDLMLSSSIIISHGGRIGYKQSDQGGGMFWFTLPIE